MMNHKDLVYKNYLAKFKIIKASGDVVKKEELIKFILSRILFLLFL